MSTDLQIIVRRKITAIQPNGARLQNLGIPRTREIIGERDAVDLTVDTDDAPDAMALAERLAKESGMVVIERGGDAFVMCKPGVADTYRRPTKIETPAAVVADLPAQSAWQRGGLIIISPVDTFTSYAKAKDFVVTRAGWGTPAKPPTRYHTDLTETFFKGTPTGQIHSLFKDVKRYGVAAVAPKIKVFAEFVERDTNPVWAKYNSWRKHGMTPDLIQTHITPNRVDSDYFKFYLLMDLLKDYQAAQAAG